MEELSEQGKVILFLSQVIRNCEGINKHNLAISFAESFWELAEIPDEKKKDLINKAIELLRQLKTTYKIVQGYEN